MTEPPKMAQPTEAGRALAAAFPPGTLPELVPYDRPVEELKGALFTDIDAGFTAVRSAIAETGSLVLWPSPEEPRLLSLVPPLHIALLRSAAIRETFLETIREEGWALGMPANALLISGPNAGGKTVALKTVGLAALMARAGLHLTCESGSAFGWFHDIVTDIGDAQNLDKDLSTFSGHVVNLRELLEHAAPGMLVLIDEITVGTDPDQGASLAQAVLEALAQKGVTGLVTTHYDRLKTLGAANDNHFANASVGFDLEKLEPTFKLHLGMPGSSGALAVATRMGLAKSVVERARELIGVQGTKVEDLLANVADQQRRIEQERAALLAELEAAESERAATKMERERASSRYEKQLRAAHNDALTALRSARREIDEVRAELRRKQQAELLTTDDTRAATRRLVTPGADVARHEPKRKLPPGTPATVESLVIGAPVIVPRLGRCEVVAPPHDGKVEVRLGSMRALVPIDEVLMDSHRAARAAERERELGAHAGADHFLH